MLHKREGQTAPLTHLPICLHDNSKQLYKHLRAYKAIASK